MSTPHRYNEQGIDICLTTPGSRSHTVGIQKNEPEPTSIKAEPSLPDIPEASGGIRDRGTTAVHTLPSPSEIIETKAETPARVPIANESNASKEMVGLFAKVVNFFARCFR